MSGLYCNTDTIVDRGKVACMLDRLTLLSAGSDQNIAGVFRKGGDQPRFLRPARSVALRNTKKVEPNPTVAALKLRGAFKAR